MYPGLLPRAVKQLPVLPPEAYWEQDEDEVDVHILQHLPDIVAAVERGPVVTRPRAVPLAGIGRQCRGLLKDLPEPMSTEPDVQ